MELKEFNEKGFKLVEHDVLVRESIVDTFEMEDEKISEDMSLGTSDVRDVWEVGESKYFIEDKYGNEITGNMEIEEVLNYIKELKIN